MIIAVEPSVAQHLHVNIQGFSDQQTLQSPLTWSVRVTGDFVILVNNLFALPVIVRHPQRFNDSRSFVTAFKREFLRLLDRAPVPHAKVQLIRDEQFAGVTFTAAFLSSTRQYLQQYQNMLIGPTSRIDWDAQPTNTDLALCLADQTKVSLPDVSDQIAVLDFFEDYVMDNYQIAAHPKLNEHSRGYLFRTRFLNDVMNATAVADKIIGDYHQYLNHHQKSGRVIDHNLDVADDYLAYCEACGNSVLDDLSLVYNYLLHFSELHDRQLSSGQLTDLGIALRDFACFLRYKALLSKEDFEEFVLAIAQGYKDLQSNQRSAYLQRLISSVRQQVNDQRFALGHAYRYANKRYQLKVALNNYEPSMWRRLTVDGDIRLDRLCYIVLAIFNADGHHLYELRDQQTSYQLPSLDSGIGDSKNLLEHCLGEYQPGAELTLIYDFGDLWTFTIKVENVTHQLPLHSKTTAKLLAGQGHGIIEDIGGVDGLYQAAKDDPSIDAQLNIEKEQIAWPAKIAKLQANYE